VAHNFCFYLGNSGAEMAFDFFHSVALAKVSGLVEMQEAGAEILKDLTCDPLGH
jgi:hypothetical protein